MTTTPAPDAATAPPPNADHDWWRGAVVYQIYPRSFADADGDGTGDVRGIIDRLPHLAGLGVDALWISPWYPSPLADGGYDVSDYRGIHPDFGTLADADELIAKAHAAGLRILLDLVPNHTSIEHPAFAAAVAGGPDAPERALFHFREGRGDGFEPPNNWAAMFGGPAWTRITEPDGTPGPWYLHLFAPEQPDWNWENPDVADEFDAILRFWFDRGVDGFRIDVADSMVKDAAMPDLPIDPNTGVATLQKIIGGPVRDRPEVEHLHRRWRAVADAYDPPRMFVSEAWLTPAPRLAKYVAPGRLHSTFNFDQLNCEWAYASLRSVIDHNVRAYVEVGAPCSWVLSNHDAPRVASRYGKSKTGRTFNADGVVSDASVGPGGWEAMLHLETDLELGRRRARAAALLELALPGSAYVYQGDELGLDEVEDLPDDARQDPTWFRTDHALTGRDGCRVPLPWSGEAPPFGFGPGAGQPWLPQPARWAGRTVADQDGDPDSHLTLYRAALAERRANPALGDGPFAWDDDATDGVLAFTRVESFRCLVNLGSGPTELPPGDEVILASGDLDDGALPVDTAVWLKVGRSG
ncbi:glycoside hydrolase family 13 protein [Mariniluteicoccus flavus]